MKRIGILVAALAVLGGCASLGDLLVFERPTATLDAVRVTGLSFEGAELTADITIENPNSVGISLTQLSYQFDVEGSRVLSGTTPDGLTIAAFGESRVSVPLAVTFDEIRDVVRIAAGQWELAYLLTTRLSFELPVLGEVTIPLEQDGTLPVVRLPRVEVAELRLESIGFSGAQLQLSLEVENPNGFPLGFERLQYNFAVQDQTWIDGGTERGTTIGELGSERLDLGFSLSFVSLGRSLRDLLLGGDEIRYLFAGALTVDPGLPLLPRTTLPYELRGAIPLSR